MDSAAWRCLFGLLLVGVGTFTDAQTVFLNRLIVELTPTSFGAGPVQVVQDLDCNPAASVFSSRLGAPKEANLLIPLRTRPLPSPRLGPDDPEIRLLNMIVLDYPDDATTVTMLNRLGSDAGVRTVTRDSLGTYFTPPPSGTVGQTAPAFGWVFEWWYPQRDHYFLTQDHVEFHRLDIGCLPGWIPTEAAGFYAKEPGSGPRPGYGPVCRFYGRPEAGLDTHFFSASPAECAEVAQRYPYAWILETFDAFEVALPDLQTGACPATTIPVYRLYNNRPDVNHRYVTSLAIRNAMALHGWIPEGYGPDAVSFCVPATYPN
jgi:hypothetical protein